MEWGRRYETLDLECEEGIHMEKNSGLSGILKRSSKISESSGLAQGRNGNLSKSNDNLSDNGAKDKAGVFSGMFKKNTKPAEDCLQNKLSGSNDSLNANNNTKEKGGVFSGILKKAVKPSGDGLSTQVSLGDDHELSASNESLSDKTNPKEKGGMFSGIFRKSPKPPGDMSQATLSVDKDLSASNDSLSESSTKKEKPGMLSGMFKRSPKPNHKRTASQENLCEQSDISASNDSLSENSNPKTGMMGKIRRNPFQSTAQDRERTEKSSDAKISQPKQEKGSDSEMEEMADSGRHAGHKQNVLVGAMSKLNPFRPATKEDKDSEREDEDVSAGSENHSHRKQKLTSGMESEDELERDDNEMKKELSSTASSSQLRTATAGGSQVNSIMTQKENKSMAKPPPVPPKPKEKELTARMKEIELKDAQTKVLQGNGAECCDEARQVSNEEKKDGEEEIMQSTTKKAKKPKNLSMPQVEPKDESDDGLEDRRERSTEEKIPEQEAPSTKPKKKNPKKSKNPFMSKLATKGKTLQKKNENEEGAPGDGSAEGNGQKKSLFEQLDELRFDKPEDEEEEEEDKDLNGLMEWWNTVEQWEDMQQNDDMTEKEEAKAFALTADKVQKGIRVFNKLFTERAEGLWQHVIDLNAIADGLDTFNKKTKIAQITGGSTSAVGGTLTIAGLALAPVTLGTSLIVTAVGLGIAAAGGLTSASAGISNQVNNSLDRKKVERIVEDYQTKILDLNKCMKFIKQGIENLRRFDLIKMKKQAYNQDFPALNNIYEDGAMAGKAILINANEIMRVVQIANVAGSTAARAVQIASMATGILTGLFVGMDIYFVAKDSRELKKGAKSEFAAKIREVAEQLHEGLVELNSIREELQTTTGPEGKADNGPPETRDETEDIDEIKRKLKSNPPPSYDDTADIDEIKCKLKSNPPPSYDDTADMDEIKRKLKSIPPPSYDDTVDIDEIKRKPKSIPPPSYDDTDKKKGQS